MSDLYLEELVKRRKTGTDQALRYVLMALTAIGVVLSLLTEKKPEKAAPEDLQRIKENWKNIVMQTQGMFKTFLTTAVPKYNGNTGENKLYVEFSNDLAQTCVDDPDKKQLLEDLILKMTGKTVEVEMLLKKTNMHQDLAEISVDDILKQTVHMNIVVEEEPEDE